MTKLLSLALTLLCAIIIGDGSIAFAQTTDGLECDFPTAIVKVSKGDTHIYSLNFAINMFNTNSRLECEALFSPSGEAVSSSLHFMRMYRVQEKT